MGKKKSGSADMIIAGMVIITIGLMVIPAIVNSDNTTEQKQKITQEQKAQQTQQEQQQKQQRLNTIKSIMKNAEKAGLIKNYRKDDEGKNLHILVDENVWNQLPYDTKQQMWQMCFEYHRLTGYLTGIVGYYSGKSMK